MRTKDGQAEAMQRAERKARMLMMSMFAYDLGRPDGTSVKDMKAVINELVVGGILPAKMVALAAEIGLAYAFGSEEVGQPEEN